MHLLLILGACALDALLGDPVYRLHPIRVLGAWTLLWERGLFRLGLDGRVGGILLWIATVGGALAAWWAVRGALDLLHPWLAFGWDLFIAYSLALHARSVESGTAYPAGVGGAACIRGQDGISIRGKISAQSGVKISPMIRWSLRISTSLRIFLSPAANYKS